MKNPLAFTRFGTKALVAVTLAAASFSHAQEIMPSRAASVNPNGTLGMSQVIGAEGVGAGTVNLSVRGALYNQARSMSNVSRAGETLYNGQVSTATLGAALGLNQYLDAFTGMSVYNVRADGNVGSGWGSTYLGAKFNVPFARSTPVRMAGQVMGVFGTSNNQINNNGLDGYNYLETRDYTDVVITLSQSILLNRNPKETGFKIHFNEGIVSSFEPGREIALVAGAGVEFIPIISLIAGLEINSRTYLSEPSAKDPLWVTPSITWRTPALINVNLGADISIASDRADAGYASRSLEPWRVFGGLTYSIDTRKDRRAAAAARRAELYALRRANDSLARAALTYQAKSRLDSATLAQELERRPEMQKQLLTSGMLVLDAVYFETGKTEISINSEPYLEIVAKLLTQYPTLQIEIGGHTDNVGGLDYNQELSEGRSAAVVRYMVAVSPSLQGRLSSRGYAYTQPKATNDTPEGRELNRRTELKVTNPEALKEYR
jgi:outer membrane protein OmpA-like peptidoglycan-associated protein